MRRMAKTITGIFERNTMSNSSSDQNFEPVENRQNGKAFGNKTTTSNFNKIGIKECRL